MTVRYLDLADYLAIAAEATGLDAVTITKVANAHLADSAPHAPAAGFGDVDLYPEFLLKAAVLLVRLAKNHPLPDGNKRAAWGLAPGVRRAERLAMAGANPTSRTRKPW